MEYKIESHGHPAMWWLPKGKARESGVGVLIYGFTLGGEHTVPYTDLVS